MHEAVRLHRDKAPIYTKNIVGNEADLFHLVIDIVRALFPILPKERGRGPPELK